MKLATKLTLAALALLTAGGTFVNKRAAQHEAQAEVDYPPEGDFVTVDGRRVHYVMAGQGPDLVLIHGASGNTRDFTFAFVDQVKDDYRVIVFDRPGLGYTDRASDEFGGPFNTAAESPADQAIMLQAAAAQLGADKPIVLGHSYGGTIALAWALERPDSIAAVINVAAPSNPWPGRLGALYRINGTALGGAMLPPLITAFASQQRIEDNIASIFDPQVAPEGYAHYVGATLTTRRAAFRANGRQVNSLRPHVVEMSKRYGDITIPVEIIHGDADTIVPLEIHSIPLSRQVPHATLTVLDGVGHMPHHVSSDVVIAAIDRAAVASGLR
ncbi:alpha/beta fold hydrolase [Octadecabacter sp. R77987]|uniref:alpha/beta fold hydrolase n=1 Tax=Octadecabacter sp. R77987 TaxID=3093874 RepID=UPI00366FA596